MTPQPQTLKLVDPSTLEIVWSDGETRRYSISKLREACPCASCIERRQAPPPPATDLPVISTAEAQPLRIAKMEPMGHYAYSIVFSDGHDTGLFTLEHLRELGEAVE